MGLLRTAAPLGRSFGTVELMRHGVHVRATTPSLDKPVLVMRNVTERPEAVEAGTARLVGADRERIVGNITMLLDTPSELARMTATANPYGGGNAADRIVQSLRTS